MSSDFVNYSRKVLTTADQTALAAALTTIYREGVRYFPRERDWDGFYWNHVYSIGLKPIDRSYIVINIAHSKGNHLRRFHLFSVNTNRQEVAWKCGKNIIDFTPVPEIFRPFLRRLTDTVHDIHVKRTCTEALKLKRKTEEEAKKASDAEWDRKRRTMERENERMEKAAQAQPEGLLKHKLSCRKAELRDALRVMSWKASAAAKLSAVPALDEKPTEVGRKMVESAIRGPQHDLCEVCGETLRYCAHEGCYIIGCIKCFKNELTMCANCSNVVYCAKHADDLNECFRCESLVRVKCET